MNKEPLEYFVALRSGKDCIIVAGYSFAYNFVHCQLKIHKFFVSFETSEIELLGFQFENYEDGCKVMNEIGEETVPQNYQVFALRPRVSVKWSTNLRFRTAIRDVLKGAPAVNTERCSVMIPFEFK